jgi:hypothetical protein
MDTPLVIFALIAVVAMGMMVFVNSGVTGQPITIDRLTPEMAKKVSKVIEKEQYYPPPAGPACDCPDYGDSILTTKDHFLAGLSKWDCELINEVIQLRKEVKKPTTDLEQWRDFCKMYWPYN